MRPRILELLRSALLLCLVLTSSAAQAGIEEHMQAIGGTADRALGAVGETLTADYVQSVFAALPRELHAVTGRQQFTTPIRKFTSASLTMDGRKTFLHPLYANALSPETVPPEGLSGELVYVGEGRLEDFDGKRVAGNIVLMNLDSGRGWQNAANLGARALVYLDRGDTAAPRLRFRDKEELTPVDFPRYWVPFDKFESRIGPVEEIQGRAARLEGRTEWTKHVASNVYCFIPGQNPKLAGELLLVETFLDSSRYVPQHAPGADEGTSLATLLHLAQGFAAAPPERSILLLASTGRGNNLRECAKPSGRSAAKKRI